MGHQVQEEASLERVQVHPDASVQDKSCDVSNVLAAHIQKVLLPPTEPSSFSGDVQSYRLFVKAFDARIVSRTQDKSELLYYLAHFTKGKPHQIVRSCLSLGEEGYDEARRLLEGRYGSAYCLVDSYVDRLKLWPRILPGDVEGLDKLALFHVEVQNAMAGACLTGAAPAPGAGGGGKAASPGASQIGGGTARSGTGWSGAVDGGWCLWRITIATQLRQSVMVVHHRSSRLLSSADHHGLTQRRSTAGVRLWRS